MAKHKYNSNYYTTKSSLNKQQKKEAIQQLINPSQPIATTGISTKPSVLIGTLAQDLVQLGYVTSLMNLRRPAGSTIMFTQSTIIPHGRDTLVDLAIKGNYEYLLFIDSDMTFPADGLERLLSHKEADIVSGLCFARKLDHSPCVFKYINYVPGDPAKSKAYAETDIDRDYFEITGCGMAFCLIKVDVLKAVKEKYGSCFSYLGNFGEDISFCIKAVSLGYKLYCDGSFRIGHIGSKEFSREDWVPKVINNPEDANKPSDNIFTEDVSNLYK